MNDAQWQASMDQLGSMIRDDGAKVTLSVTELQILVMLACLGHDYCGTICVPIPELAEELRARVSEQAHELIEFLGREKEHGMPRFLLSSRAVIDRLIEAHDLGIKKA